MPQGLTAFILPEGPDMWHEFALGVEFAAPCATIDLLMAADAVTAQPTCDHATAALILAKAAGVGFHRGDAPAAYDDQAAHAFANRLTDGMVTGRFATARFGLPPEALRLVIRQLGPHGPLALPPLSLGKGLHRPRYVFEGWHAVRQAPEARRA
jgi:hypothetical protein